MMNDFETCGTRVNAVHTRKRVLEQACKSLKLWLQDVLFNSGYQKECIWLIGRCIDVQHCTGRCCIVNITTNLLGVVHYSCTDYKNDIISEVLYEFEFYY